MLKTKLLSAFFLASACFAGTAFAQATEDTTRDVRTADRGDDNKGMLGLLGLIGGLGLLGLKRRKEDERDVRRTVPASAH